MDQEIKNTADGYQWHITEKEAADAGLALLKFSEQNKRPALNMGEAMGNNTYEN